MKIKDISFQQELNLDKTNVQGGIFDPASFQSFTQFQYTSQNVNATSGGGRDSNTIASPAIAVGIQVPIQIVSIVNF